MSQASRLIPFYIQFLRDSDDIFSVTDAFYGNEDPNLANVDVMTDVSNPGTMFTRYTVAPSSMTDRSK